MVVYDHVALGIVLPGVMTRAEKWYRSIWNRKRSIRTRNGVIPDDLQRSGIIVDPDFDENPIHRWHGATN